MTNIKGLIDAVIRKEGGYSNNPSDRGGPTHYGITLAVARQNGYDGDMRAMPRSVAETIYQREYWEKPGFIFVAEISPVVGAELFDTGINMGTKTATKFLQRALNVMNRQQKDYADMKVDGIVGARTLQALRAFVALRGKSGHQVMLKAIDALQGERYIALAESRPANEQFLYGWIANRVD